MVFKPYILYAVLAWQVPPLMTESQKTLVFDFAHEDDCKSVVQQIIKTMKAEQGLPFRFKTLQCSRCEDLFEESHCLQPKTKAPPKAKK